MTFSKSNKSCAYEYLIDHKYNHNNNSCQALCDENPDCKFLFVDVTGWCALFTSCSELGPYQDIGYTFQKQGIIIIYN